MHRLSWAKLFAPRRTQLGPTIRQPHRLFDREARKLATVGSCGSFGYCGLFAPVACYTCSLFQPWLDGPHEAVLADLVRRRERNLERGTDQNSPQLHDLTIYAVAEVVERCRRMNNVSPTEATHRMTTRRFEARRAASEDNLRNFVATARDANPFSEIGTPSSDDGQKIKG
jgi:hypothetical protein